MLAIRLALRNLIGAGLRTWLNVIVLSFAFVVIVWHKGLLDGWDRQARKDMISWDVAGGQYWQGLYDPYDPFTLAEAHDKVPESLVPLVKNGDATPLLIVQGTLYPQGRMQGILVKGIDPEQIIIDVPAAKLKGQEEGIPAIIGSSMATSAHLKQGDRVILRWRDRNSAFDATEIFIAGIFQTNVPVVDGNQVWIPLQNLREMMLLPGEATLLVMKTGTEIVLPVPGWVWKDQDLLLHDLDKIIKTKTFGGMVIWGILLMLAMLAIFDTQVLSIFRRQKEIGTYVAMGMTRKQVVALFTVEGGMHSVLAALAGALYGYPLLSIQAVRGIALPVKGSDYGIAMAEKLFPVYSLGLIFGTILVVVLVTTLVSYLPARKIARMNPTEALRGKIQ